MAEGKKVRNTAARTEILAMIQRTEAALSHAEIQARLNGLCDRVTIYRVLDRLAEEGYVHRVVNIDGVVKFARCHDCEEVHNHHHAHFSCLKCKSVTCLDDVRPAFQLPGGYRLEDVNITLSGLCPHCSAR